MSAGSSMKINSLPAKSGFCKNLTKRKSQELFSIFSIVGTLNGLIWWNKKKFECFHLTWDSRFLQAVALNALRAGDISIAWPKTNVWVCLEANVTNLNNIVITYIRYILVKYNLPLEVAWKICKFLLGSLIIY
jgi:hypothetical protein